MIEWSRRASLKSWTWNQGLKMSGTHWPAEFISLFQVGHRVSGSFCQLALCLILAPTRHGMSEESRTKTSCLLDVCRASLFVRWWSHFHFSIEKVHRLASTVAELKEGGSAVWCFCSRKGYDFPCDSGWFQKLSACLNRKEMPPFLAAAALQAKIRWRPSLGTWIHHMDTHGRQ